MPEVTIGAPMDNLAGQAEFDESQFDFFSERGNLVCLEVSGSKL